MGEPKPLHPTMAARCRMCGGFTFAIMEECCLDCANERFCEHCRSPYAGNPGSAGCAGSECVNEPGRVVRELLDVHLHQATGTPEGWREAAHQTCLLADDAWRLAAMARECRGPLLELGTRHGLTAALFALCGLDVVTVDIEASPWRTRVWDACGVSGRVLAVEDGEIPPGPYGSAFIDADHSYDGCRRHWDEVEPHLQAGAIVLLDDMDYPAGGGRFWREVGAEDFGRFGRLRT